MARSVSLSDEAFAVLRRDKREGESDSDVLLRLHLEAHRRAKDPMAFFRNPPRSDRTPEEHLDFIERMDRADRHDPWDG